MKSLTDILEGLLDTDFEDKFKTFPGESDFIELIKLWDGLMNEKGISKDHAKAISAMDKTQDLVMKGDFERTDRPKIIEYIRYKEDVVIIIPQQNKHGYGLYACHPQSKECFGIFKCADRVNMCGEPIINMKYVSTYGPNPYRILPGVCWEPLKNALSFDFSKYYI